MTAYDQSEMAEFEEGGWLARWRYVACAVQGEAHRQHSIPCQDACAHWVSDQFSAIPIALIALADGAGSASQSERGSYLAVTSAVEAVSLVASRGVLPSGEEEESSGAARLLNFLFSSARATLEKEAEETNTPLREFATTLMLGLIMEEEIAVGQIGDGIIAVLSRSGEITAPAPPQRGEYANESFFLTSGRTLHRPMSASLPRKEVDGIAMSSDGLRLVVTEDVALGVPYPPFFEDAFKSLRSGLDHDALESFLLRVDDRTGDDKSLIVAAVSEEE